MDQELGFVQVSLTVIYEDNNGYIVLGNSGHFKERSNHIDLRLFLSLRLHLTRIGQI